MPARNEECSICTEPLGTGPHGPVTTAMGHRAGAVWHAFHVGCISALTSRGDWKCPLCRAQVNPWSQVPLA